MQSAETPWQNSKDSSNSFKNNNTKIIRDCIIYDKDGVLEEEKINFDRILKMGGDWTGYEVSCNELRFNLEVISSGYFLKFADKLSSMLIQKYTQKK